MLPILETNRLILREINLADSEDMFEYAKTDYVGPTAGWAPHKTIVDTKIIITNFTNMKKVGELGVWAIVEKSSKKMIGTIELYNYHYRYMAELGYSLNYKYWSKGYTTEAAEAVLKYGFEGLRLKRIEAGTFVSNVASIRVCEKIGLKKEGILKNGYLRYDGVIFDKLVFGITDEDYYKLKIKYN